MSTMSLKSLVEKLTPSTKQSLERAAALCNSRSHFNVEIQHWLLALCEQPPQEFASLSTFFSLDIQTVSEALHANLALAKTGNAQAPSLSPQLVALLRSAWMSATIAFDASYIHSGHVLHALLSDESVLPFSGDYLRALEVIDPNTLVAQWPQIMQNVPAATEHNTHVGSTHLEQFTIDLTAQAREGKIDPILGRDDEIRQMIDILSRRRQNNPILTGEAGVGKTAVVEGLALRIAAQDVPLALQNVTIRVLDLALLQAGAGMKGEFENRLKSVIKEVKAAPSPIIVFIDEAHTLIGSGGQAGQNDAANILKPALARGELRTIAATTWAEYKKYFEKDAALARRFQVVKVDEPSESQAVVMLRGLLPVMEQHHGVKISDQALKAAVSLSHRYINGRQLPDKAVALLDTACARVAMSQTTSPGLVEGLLRQQQQLQAQIKQLEQEQAIGAEHQNEIDALKQSLSQTQNDYQRHYEQWQGEQNLVQGAKQEISDILQEKDTQVLSTDEAQKGRARLIEIKANLAERKQPMVFLDVDEQVIAEVISDWTGIPLGRMQDDELHTVLNLEARLRARVVGQDHALAGITKVVQTARAQLSDERKPNGVFLLTGPSGTGKTETALALAELVYGSEQNLTVINMSEFKEEHKVSLLLGSPPGYVGYGEGGVLTEAVRRKPYSVVLLDEMEKAHSGVQDIFYQVFDKGSIKDGEGRDIDFKNTIIIMTSNVGSETTSALFEDELTSPDIDGLSTALQDDLLKVFKPAFLGRLSLIPYLPLKENVIKDICKMQLDRIAQRYAKSYNASLSFTDKVLDKLCASSLNSLIGARAVQSHIENELLPVVSSAILQGFLNKNLADAELDFKDKYKLNFLTTLNNKTVDKSLVNK